MSHDFFYRLGDKSRTYQKKVNLQTNETEENKEYINIDEGEREREREREMGEGEKRLRLNFFIVR